MTFSNTACACGAGWNPARRLAIGALLVQRVDAVARWTLLLSLPLAHALAATGQIQGKLIADTGGAALSGALVRAYRLSPAPTVIAAVTSASDGTFGIPGMPTGKYGLAVKPVGGPFVDPSQWVDLQFIANVVDGQTVSTPVLRVKDATVLKVRINDPSQALAKKPGDTVPPHVLVGVMDRTGIFHPSPVVSRQGPGTNYELPMPYDFPVRLQIFSGQVTIEDENHNPLPASGLDTVILQPSSQKGAAQKVYVFNVLGRKP